MNTQSTMAIWTLWALLGTTGCASEYVAQPEAVADEQSVESSEQALIRGSGGLNATGECDKSIEGDCENLTALCTDATVDALIACIQGWLTTHCSCTLAAVAPPKPPIKQLPIGSLQRATLRAAR
jgi:hypothetical protein